MHICTSSAGACFVTCIRWGPCFFYSLPGIELDTPPGHGSNKIRRISDHLFCPNFPAPHLLHGCSGIHNKCMCICTPLWDAPAIRFRTDQTHTEKYSPTNTRPCCLLTWSLACICHVSPYVYDADMQVYRYAVKYLIPNPPNHNQEACSQSMTSMSKFTAR